MERIYRYSITLMSGGNISVHDEDGSIWITPARVEEGNVTREDIVRAPPDGTTEGRHPASSEFPFHLSIYKNRPDLRVIDHVHPVYATAFSPAQKKPDVRTIPESYIFLRDVQALPFAWAYRDGKEIADAVTPE